MITKRSKIREIADLPGITDLLKSHTGQEISPAMLKLASAIWTFHFMRRFLN